MLIERIFVSYITMCIDGNCRTNKSKVQKVIVDLSLGGLHTLYILAIDYVGLFSAQSVNFVVDENLKTLANISRRIENLSTSIPFLNRNSDEKKLASQSLNVENVYISDGLEVKLKT